MLVGDEVYLISGWPSGANQLRKYNFITREWNYLPNSPNTSTWGVTAEYLNGHIYLFQPTNGNVYDYSITDSIWTTKTNAGVTGPLNLSSILYKDEIYVIGYSDSAFVKYSPSTDIWTPLAKPPYPVGASAMGIINDKIYNVGGNANGSSSAEYKSIIVYDISQNSWTLDSLTISGKRHWMSTAEYEGGLYVLGGIDSATQSVDIVEQIVPQGTATALEQTKLNLPITFHLYQNYPNPFNPQTEIRYDLSKSSAVELDVYDLAGRKVQTLFKGIQQAGKHRLLFNAGTLSSGMYFYTIAVRNSSYTGSQSRKMFLIK